MEKIQQYTLQIKSAFPELVIRSVKLNRDGQYNDVLVVNDSLVFRFARVQDAIEVLNREVAVLNYLQDKISLSIPDPLYVNIDSTIIGEAFVGYRMIPGIPLWRKNFRQISESGVRQKIAVQLAEFLRELHEIPVDKIPFAFQVEDTPEHWAKMYAQIQENLFPSMRVDARRAVTEHFEEYFQSAGQHPFRPTLRHGDFGTGNILFDPEKQLISGVIDFGGAGVGDPAGDFAGLYISFGEDFYRSCYSVYPEMASALERVKFFCGTFALQEALFGFENHDQEAFHAGMEQYV